MATAGTDISSSREALEFAVRSIQRADLETGRAALRWVLRKDPENGAALKWLKRCDERSEDEILRLAQEFEFETIMVQS